MKAVVNEEACKGHSGLQMTALLSFEQLHKRRPQRRSFYAQSFPVFWKLPLLLLHKTLTIGSLPSKTRLNNENEKYGQLDVSVTCLVSKE